MNQTSRHERQQVRISCDRCELCMIQGVACHEHGCPNSGKSWVAAGSGSMRAGGGYWVRYVDCAECGDELEEGSVCDCQYRECAECGGELIDNDGNGDMCDCQYE